MVTVWYSCINMHTWTFQITYNIAQMSSSLDHMADLFIPSKYHSITLDFRQSQDLSQRSIILDFGHNLDCACIRWNFGQNLLFCSIGLDIVRCKSFFLSFHFSFPRYWCYCDALQQNQYRKNDVFWVITTESHQKLNQWHNRKWISRRTSLCCNKKCKYNCNDMDKGLERSEAS